MPGGGALQRWCVAALAIPSAEADGNLGLQDQLVLEEYGVLTSPLLAPHPWLPGRDPWARLLVSPTPNLGRAAGFALELPGGQHPGSSSKQLEFFKIVSVYSQGEFTGN